MLTETDRQELYSLLEQIDPTEFEYFVADCFEADGWSTTVTQQSGDEAIDFIMSKSKPVPQRIPVQVKHREDTKNKFGATDVRPYTALDQKDPSFTSCMFVGNAKFTTGAKSEAHDRQQFSLFDVDDIIQAVAENGMEGELRRAIRGESSKDDANEEFNLPSVSNPMVGTPTVDPKTWNLRGEWFPALSVTILIQVLALTEVATETVYVSTGAAAGLLMLSMLATPVILFFDARELHRDKADFRPNRLLWPLFSFMVPVLVPALYVYRRL